MSIRLYKDEVPSENTPSTKNGVIRLYPESTPKPVSAPVSITNTKVNNPSSNLIPYSEIQKMTPEQKTTYKSTLKADINKVELPKTLLKKGVKVVTDAYGITKPEKKENVFGQTAQKIADLFIDKAPLPEKVKDVAKKVTPVLQAVTPAGTLSSDGATNMVDKAGKALLNTPTGKKVASTVTETTSNLPIKAWSKIIDVSDPAITYKEAYDFYKQKAEDPNNTVFEQFLWQLQNSAPQTLVGVALGFVPFAGTALAPTYWTALSADEQIKKYGKVVSLENIGIDVALDSVLGSSIEGMLKIPQKTLIPVLTKSFLSEGGTEVVQSVLKGLNNIRTAPDKKSKDIAFQELKDYFKSGEAIMEFAVGGVSGAGTGLGAYTVKQLNSLNNKAMLPENKNNPDIINTISEVKDNLLNQFESTKENVVSIPLENSESPMVEINVADMGKEKWSVDFNVNTNDSGFSSPFTNNGSFNSKDQAVNYANSEIVKWANSEMDNVSDESKAQLNNIINKVIVKTPQEKSLDKSKLLRMTTKTINSLEPGESTVVPTNTEDYRKLSNLDNIEYKISKKDDFSVVVERIDLESEAKKYDNKDKFLMSLGALTTDTTYATKKRLLAKADKTTDMGEWIDEFSDELKSLGLKNYDELKQDVESTKRLIEKEMKLSKIWDDVNQDKNVSQEAKDLVESRTTDEIQNKLEKIFGTYKELEAIDKRLLRDFGSFDSNDPKLTGVSKEEYTKLDMANKYMADIEYSAKEKNYSETEELLQNYRDDLAIETKNNETNTTPLIREAKNYKSAEEFMTALNESLPDEYSPNETDDGFEQRREFGQLGKDGSLYGSPKEIARTKAKYTDIWNKAQDKSTPVMNQDIKERQAIPELDAEIRKITPPDEKKGDLMWTVEIGLQESLGEQGTILTETYESKPTLEQIKSDILKDYRETKIEINKPVGGIVAKSAYDENIEQAIDKVLLSQPTQKEIVKESLKEKPKTIKEVATETNIKEANVRRILGVGAKEGTFTRVEKGVYILNKDGTDMAYVHTGDSVEVLPQLVKEGVKVDMIFLDIPYDTPAVKGGNRGVRYNLVSVDQFSQVLDNVIQLSKNDNTPIIYMYSQAESGKVAMQKYNDLFAEKGLTPVGKGEYQKTFKTGAFVTNVRGEVSKPEGILVFNKSGELSKDLKNLNFKLVRPTGYQTEKPAEMIRQMIEMTTEEGDTVLDPFAGSGVVGEQAIETGRKAILVEKNKEVVEKNILPKLEKATPRFDKNVAKAKAKTVVERKEVKQSTIIKKVESLLKKKATIPIANNAKIKNGKLTITDLEYYLEVPGFKESNGVYKIVGGEMIKTDNKVEDFPFNDNIVEMTKNKVVSDQSGVSIDKIIEASKFAKDNRSRPELESILLSSVNGKLNIKATDAYRGYNRNLNIDWNSDKQIMLPRNVVDKVFSLLSGKVEFFIDDSAEFIKITDSKGLVVTSRLTPGDYPILGTIIEQNKYENKFTINKEELVNAIKTVKPFSDSLKIITFKKVDNNTISLSSESNVDGEKISKTVNLNITKEKFDSNIKQTNNLDIVMPISLGRESNEGMLYQLNWKYLEEALSGQDSNDIVMFSNNDNSPIIFMTKEDSDVMDMTTPKEKKIKAPSGMASMGAGKIGTFEQLAGLPNKTEPELKIFEEVKKLVAKYAKSIGENYTPSNALGVYDPNTQNIRIKGMNDLSVASHEITHFLDDSYKISDQLLGIKGYSTNGRPIYESDSYKLRKEMTDLYVKYYPTARKDHPLKKRMIEGFATLLQKYIEMPETITKSYPTIVKEFLTKDGQYYKPVMGDIIADLKSIVSKYQGLSSLDKIGSRIIDDKVNVNKDSFLNFWEKFKTEVADNIYPIEVLAKKSGTHFTTKDPSLWLRQYNNSNAIILNNLKGDKGFWGWRNGELKKLHDYNWKNLINEIHSNKEANEFGYWLVARREYFGYKELDQLEKNVETARQEMLKLAIEVKYAQEQGFDLAEYEPDMISTKAKFENAQNIYREAMLVLNKDGFTEKEVTDAYEENKERFSEYADKYDVLVKEDLKFLSDVNVGLLKPEEYNKLSSQEGYASFKRYFYDELIGDETKPMQKVRFGTSKVSSLLKRTGSQKPIINPLFSALTNHAEVTRKGLKQIVSNRIGEIAGKFPDLFQKVELKAVPDGRGRFMFPQEKDSNIIMARLNYKRVPFLTDATVKRTVDEVLNTQNLGIFEKLLMGASRFFTKGTTGLFPGFAITNYTVDQVTAVAQSRENYTPLYDPLNKIAKILDSSQPEHNYLNEYMVLGGERQTFVGWQDMSPNELFDTLANERKGLLKVVDGLNAGMNILALPSQWSEVMTRATEYIKAREAGKSQIVALEEAGRVTAPFHHIGRFGGGKVGQVYIKSIPFFNPAIQVLAQTAETLETPGGRARYLFTALAITAASIASLGLLYSRGTDEQKDLYADIHPDELNKYIWIPNPNGKTLIKIRIPDQMMVVGTLINMMIADKKFRANYNAGEYINAGLSWLPAQLDISQPAKMLMAWIPQIIKPGVLTLAGVKDFPKIMPLESRSQQAKSPDLRFTEATSPVAKWLGKTFNMSPIKIDYLLTGYAGRATGFLTGKPGIYDPLKSMSREYYFTSGRQVQDYYDMKKKNDQDYYDYQNKLRTFKVGERSSIVRLKNKLKVIDDLLGTYNDTDIEKKPQRAEKLRNEILEKINKLKNPGSTSSITKDNLTAFYNNTFGTPTAEAFSLNPFKKKEVMTPISEILPPEALKEQPKTYNLSNEVFVGQKGAFKGELKGYENGTPVYWAAFPSLEANIDAVKNDINIKLSKKPEMTIRQLVERRSPPSDDNNVDDILFTISDELWKQYEGKNGEVIFNGRTKINKMNDKQITALIKAIMVAEGHPELRYKSNQ